MTDREMLEALYNGMQSMKDDMQSMKGDMQSMKEDVQNLKEDVQAVKQKVTSIEVSLENETNHNIQILAENHINIVDKLNEAIRVQDKSILYEVQISGLKTRLDVLERELKEIKSKIA